MGKSSTDRPADQMLRTRTRQIRAAIDKITFLCSGTITTRTKVCGKKACRCATDPEARHGPYHEWTRMADGIYRHKVVSADQAQTIELGIANYREIQRLLRLWEEETAKAILTAKKLKH